MRIQRLPVIQSQHKWSLKGLVFDNLFEMIRTWWNSDARQSKQNQNGNISKAVPATFKIHLHSIDVESYVAACRSFSQLVEVEP